MLDFGRITTLMNEAQASVPVLADLETPTNNSASSVWELMKSMYGYLSSLLQKEIEADKAEIIAKIGYKKWGSREWLHDKILAFQLGDILTEIDGELTYATISPEKQIIGRVVFKHPQELGIRVNQLTTYVFVLGKVVRQIDGKETKKLTETEVGLVTGYVSRVSIFGSQFRVYSIDSDRIIFNVFAVIDTVFTFNINGSLKSDSTNFPLITWIKRFIESRQEDEWVLASALRAYLVDNISGLATVTISMQYENYYIDFTEQGTSGATDKILPLSGIYQYSNLSQFTYQSYTP
jgi:hypothetical protein